MLVIVIFLLTIVLPAAFWWYFFIWQDRAEPEPKKLLIKTFFLGMGVAIFSGALELTIFQIAFPGEYVNLNNLVNGFSILGLFAISLAGVVEELIKFSAMKEYIYSRKDFNQIADGFFYAVTMAIGFVVVENSIYFYSSYINDGVGVFVYSASIRGIATALLHITSSGMIGYAFGRMKFTSEHSRFIILKSLLLAILLHIVFNILVYFEFVGIGFIIVFLVFVYLLKRINTQESELVWRLISPRSRK